MSMMTKKDWEAYQSENIELYMEEIREQIKKVLEASQVTPVIIPARIFAGKSSRLLDCATAELQEGKWMVQQKRDGSLIYLELR
jgi:ribosome biogenesis GTPase A